MNHLWRKRAAVCFLVLALLGTLAFGCGKAKKEEKVTITIGQITDMTGPASPATKPVTWAIEDIVRYLNEEDPIPGVKLRVVTYDCMYNPARDIPGFEWCIERGAKVIYTPMPTTASTLKFFAEEDKVPVVIPTAGQDALEPPGWVFAWYPSASSLIKTVVKFVEEQWTNYPTKIKIGCAGWVEPHNADVEKGVREYAQAHPDKFEYVGGFLTSMGTMTWAGEIRKLKECDYICVPSTGMATGSFIKEARSAGYTGGFIQTDSVTGFTALILAMSGWEAVDGLLTGGCAMWWSETAPIVELTKEILHRYHSSADAEATIASGTGYCNGFQHSLIWFEAVREAVKKVGAENFDGQAFYDTIKNFTYKSKYEGYPEVSFIDSTRSAMNHIRIYEWSASARDLVSVSDWIPAVD